MQDGACDDACNEQNAKDEEDDFLFAHKDNLAEMLRRSRKFEVVRRNVLPGSAVQLSRGLVFSVRIPMQGAF